MHLPDVRLRPSARGRVRGRHPLHLHPRVRVEPRALRLGARQPRPLGPAPAPVRVRAARPRLHRDVEAEAPPAREREARLRAGTTRACRRSPGCGAAASRPEALRDFADAHRRREEQQRRRHRQARVRDPRRPRAALAARAGGPRPAPPRRHELAGRARSRSWTSPGGRASRSAAGPARSPSAASSSSSATTSPRIRRRTGSGSPRAARCGSPAATSSAATRSCAAPPGEVVELRCTHDPASLGDPAASRRASGTIHWVHAARSVPAEVRLYDRLFRGRAARRASRTSSRRSTPTRSPWREGRARRAGARRRRARDALAVPAPGLLLRGSGRLAAGRAGLQPDHHAQGHLDRQGGSEGRGGAAAASGRRRPARRRPRRGRRAPSSAPRRAPRTPRSRGATPPTRRSSASRRTRRTSSRATPSRPRTSTRPSRRRRRPAPAARWLLNDLAGLAGDRPLDALPLPGAAFGRFVALVDAGRLAAGGREDAPRRPRRRRAASPRPA